MRLPKAVLFDLDDTLIAFESVSDITWEKVCRRFVAVYNTGFDHKTLLDTLNRSRRWYWGDIERHKAGRSDMKKARREVVRHALGELDFHDEEACIDMADTYSVMHNESLHLFEGVTEALTEIKALNIKMAVITNGASEGQHLKLNRFGLTGFFDLILIDTEVGVSKPDPGIFELALKELSLEADEVWMVGDNLIWDVEGPQRLGIFSVWNDYRNRGLPEGSNVIPDMIICSVYELAQKLKGFIYEHR